MKVTLVLVLASASIALGFNVGPNKVVTTSNTDGLCGRREALLGVLGGTMAVLAGSPQPAEATYSAYTRREEDWQARIEKGEVKFSSARSLRAQLQEIAPMNTADSKIFCPNGPSSNVSPLMENRCGDRLATPSVFGRSDDVLGNSIPGRYPSVMGESSSLTANPNVGGFPKY